MSDAYVGVQSILLVSADFCQWKGKKMNCITKSNHLSTPYPRVSPLGYSGVISVKMFVLKHWVFLEDIWDFNKWKSLIIDEKYWMLGKAMLKETKESDKHRKCRREKLYFSNKYGRNKKKESNLLFPFSKLLSWATSLKLPSLE